MSTAEDLARTLLEFAAGRTSIADLSRSGIGIQITGSSVSVMQQTESEPISVDATTIASGLLMQARLGNDVTYARVVLALLDLDLAPLHETSNGERLLELLWDTSAGAHLSPANRRFLTKLVARSLPDGPAT